MNPSEGGRYEIGPDGERVLVERTNWTPEPAPKKAPEPEIEEPEFTDEED